MQAVSTPILWRRRAGCRCVAAAQAPAAASAASSALAIIPWAVSNKVEFAKVKPAQFAGEQRGLVATAAIRPREALVRVPLGACLRVWPGCPAPLPSIGAAEWAGLPWAAQLAVVLLAEAARGASSRWADYIALLPPEPVDLPVLWSADELAQLRCSRFISQVQQQQATWAALQEQLAPCLEAAGISAARLPWALSMACSRAFAAPHAPSALAQLGWRLGWRQPQPPEQQPEQQQHVLAPLIDFLNHRSGVESECEFEPASSSLRVVAPPGGWRRGSQVFISYGNSSCDALLQTYGFVEHDNAHDRFMVSCLPATLRQQGATVGPEEAAALSAVLVQRQGIAAPAATVLTQLLPSASQQHGTAADGSAAAGLLPWPALQGVAVRAVCAAALQHELASLGVDAEADAEVLQAAKELPGKRQELQRVHAGLQVAAAVLQDAEQQLAQLQLQQHEAQQQQQHEAQQQQQHEAQQQQQQQQHLQASTTDDEEVGQRVAAQAELVERLRAEQQQLAAEADAAERLVGSWAALLAAQPKLAAVGFRLAKHELLAACLASLALAE